MKFFTATDNPLTTDCHRPTKALNYLIRLIRENDQVDVLGWGVPSLLSLSLSLSPHTLSLSLSPSLSPRLYISWPVY